MRHSTSGKIPSKRHNGQVGREQEGGASSSESKLAPDGRDPTRRISPELASLLDEQETRLVMEADNVGLEQLIAALTRISIPRRKTKTPNGG